MIPANYRIITVCKLINYIIICEFVCFKQQRDDVLVRLSIGDLIGQKVTVYNVPWTSDPPQSEHMWWKYFDPTSLPAVNNITVMVFLGVPYAEPPVSQRRFKSPQILTKFPGEQPFLALEHPPSCAQDVGARSSLFIKEPYPFRISEDCLYLNIFTTSISNGGRPVIVFFHGGNFQTGSANDWPGHVLSSRGVVVVTVNYRLGAFGFLSFGGSETGNYGLKDQRTALQFVQDHIAFFGGDPRQVTIVGHDAGGVSVGLHMLSPYSKGLFRAGVAMSGSEVSYHSTISKSSLAYNNMVKLGRYLGCTHTLAEHIWDCILTRSTNDIIEAVGTIPVEYNRYLFLPHVDRNFVRADPLWLLKSIPTAVINYPSPVPYLVSLNKHDGSEVLLEDRLLDRFNNFELVDQEYLENYVLEYAFRHNYTTNRQAITEAIIHRYTYWPDPSNKIAIRNEFIRMITDAYYVAPVSLSAYLHSVAGSRVFMFVNNYEFGKSWNTSLFPDWMNVCHDCDLYLLFGFPFMPKEFLQSRFTNIIWTDTDRNASQLLTSVFRQNPNLPTDSSWLAFEPRSHWYVNFNYSRHSDLTKFGSLERDYRWESVSFWNAYIPSLVQYMTTTFSPFETKIQKQLIAYQVAMGVIICILLAVLVLMCVFAYLLCNRSSERIMRKRDFHRVEHAPSLL
ncbi:unnamed protein product [Thelazia callipaeda]|uniref:COesterase domain-containing protein n=1 Tax=Thelazia callipaeda TaxID=103827 RepID=A0A0N5D0K9_THECL|nr:unnamed protein product [Thelazia callipaeda]